MTRINTYLNARAALAAELIDELVDSYDDNRTNASLIARLRELIEPGATGAGAEENGPRGATRATAPAPWWGPAADLITDIEAGARKHERDARARLGYQPLERSASSRTAEAVLRGLPALLNQLEPNDLIVGIAIAELRSWHRQARTITGHRQPWARVRGHSCPYCEAESLRQRPRDGAVVCITPGCQTGAGDRPEWDLEELDRLGVVIQTNTGGTE